MCKPGTLRPEKHVRMLHLLYSALKCQLSTRKTHSCCCVMPKSGIQSTEYARQPSCMSMQQHPSSGLMPDAGKTAWAKPDCAVHFLWECHSVTVLMLGDSFEQCCLRSKVWAKGLHTLTVLSSPAVINSLPSAEKLTQRTVPV